MRTLHLSLTRCRRSCVCMAHEHREERALRMHYNSSLLRCSVFLYLRIARSRKIIRRMNKCSSSVSCCTRSTCQTNNTLKRKRNRDRQISEARVSFIRSFIIRFLCLFVCVDVRSSVQLLGFYFFLRSRSCLCDRSVHSHSSRSASARALRIVCQHSGERETDTVRTDERGNGGTRSGMGQIG